MLPEWRSAPETAHRLEFFLAEPPGAVRPGLVMVWIPAWAKLLDLRSTPCPRLETRQREPARDVDENGVDLTLVRYTLSLTPTQRLRAVEKFMNALATVRPSFCSSA